jgi:hypothetical protein
MAARHGVDCIVPGMMSKSRGGTENTQGRTPPLSGGAGRAATDARKTRVPAASAATLCSLLYFLAISASTAQQPRTCGPGLRR